MRRRAVTTALATALPILGILVVGPSPASAAVAGPAVTIDPTAGVHPISRDIYGMNFADEALAKELKLPVRRWGGNATTRYNYALDETNRGSDWYFENVPGSADPANLPDGSETDQFVEQDRRTGTSSILTVPMIGWVPKARDYSCGFSVAKYGPQQSTDSQWRPDCGNGVRPDGTPITGNDPLDTSTPAGAQYVHDWLTYLTGKYGSAAAGGVRFYNLDNEPDIWHSTHRDVHPTGASYDEMRDQTFTIAAAVKAADPGAQTLGPVGWGWNSLTLSGLDQQTCNAQGGSCWSNPPDRAAHGGVDFGAWYLQQMRAYEQAHGTRILDYYDNHWYPQESGVALGNGNDPTTNALRLRSTRNLWDPSYVDESWINQPTQLIPRMKQLVASNYPGTKTAVTEYNWGALDTLNGALAQADVLGIFGREGLDLAALWSPPSATQPGAYAFRMFLNYDGNGGAFGGTGIQAVSSDQDKLSAYAARRADGALTVVLVNKTGDDLSSGVTFKNVAQSGHAQVYRYSGADLTAISHEADVTVTPAPVCSTCPPQSNLSTTFPANSITTLVLSGGDTTAPTAPGKPTVTNVTGTSFTASWAPSTDNVGVTGYDVWVTHEDTVEHVGSTDGATTTLTVTGRTPNQTYGVFVRARDAAGNTSPSSPTTSVTTTSAPTTCTATYQLVNQWPGGFQASVTLHNTGTAPWHGWTVAWTYANGQKVNSMWGATVTQTGPKVSARSLDWDSTVAVGSTVTLGFTGTLPGTANTSPAPTCSST